MHVLKSLDLALSKVYDLSFLQPAVLPKLAEDKSPDLYLADLDDAFLAREIAKEGKPATKRKTLE